MHAREPLATPGSPPYWCAARFVDEPAAIARAATASAADHCAAAIWVRFAFTGAELHWPCRATDHPLPSRAADGCTRTATNRCAGAGAYPLQRATEDHLCPNVRTTSPTRIVSHADRPGDRCTAVSRLVARQPHERRPGRPRRGHLTAPPQQRLQHDLYVAFCLLCVIPCRCSVYINMCGSECCRGYVFALPLRTSGKALQFRGRPCQLATAPTRCTSRHTLFPPCTGEHASVSADTIASYEYNRRAPIEKPCSNSSQQWVSMAPRPTPFSPNAGFDPISFSLGDDDRLENRRASPRPVSSA